MLECLVYVSCARRLFSQDELAALLVTSRANNAAAGITGLLLHVGGNFMQVLEGEAPNVYRSYMRIALDSRHTQVKTLLRLPVAERLFGEWTMAFKEAATLPPAVQAEISSFIDEAQRPDSDDALRAGHPVMRLLARFAQTMR